MLSIYFRALTALFLILGVCFVLIFYPESMGRLSGLATICLLSTAALLLLCSLFSRSRQEKE
ncbi:hypothetical protein [Fructobacillus papyrifericola]|uniref:Uncharacterized protein n=1 Tax=Fructobacillus papyrifericola TaxID=2713172 RepID=A0ABS5QWN8_9LACO|nr:hypothetical protein [Fructobacillus papyrifericola]MBS9336327.1 hypothetical protein [Fructobacillus papyrifericola]